MKRPQVVAGDVPADIAEIFRKSSELAIDCEMMGLNPNRDRLCIVQIMVEKGPCVLVQVDESAGAPEMRALFENPDIIKIFHYARTDLLFLKMRLGIDTRNVYCTKIASRLARTYTDRHGLKELVREIIGESMDKSLQSSDWGREKLTEEQVTYAAYDVAYLFQIKRELEKMLVREQRRELATRLFDFLPVRLELDRHGFALDLFEH
ncbi:MAG: ribonuclease D [Leptospiraceae bacterium]|nr:ribonuclease D [Leptospiraceae bacterium]